MKLSIVHVNLKRVPTYLFLGMFGLIDHSCIVLELYLLYQPKDDIIYNELTYLSQNMYHILY